MQILSAASYSLATSPRFVIELAATVLILAMMAYFAWERGWSHPIANSILGGIFFGLSVGAVIRAMTLISGMDEGLSLPRQAAMFAGYGLFVGLIMVLLAKQKSSIVKISP